MRGVIRLNQSLYVLAANESEHMKLISFYAQEQLPVIDVHLHALAADGQGPPPIAMCTPSIRSPPGIQPNLIARRG